MADEVVLAVPAFAAADILNGACPMAAARLRQIDYASVATILLEYGAEALSTPLDGSGFLVPRIESKTLTACTWCSAKWAHLAGETAVLKASVGRDGDEAALELDDGELIDRVHGELREAMGLRESPRLATVARWPRALAQYRVGHLDLVDQIEADLSAVPGVRDRWRRISGSGRSLVYQVGRGGRDRGRDLTCPRNRSSDRDRTVNEQGAHHVNSRT